MKFDYVLLFSACIQYPGFCRDYELTLTDAVGEEVEWEEEDKLPATLVERIKNRKTDTNNPMQIGWKLEAVDLMDPKLICPATVTVSGNYFFPVTVELPNMDP